MNRLCTATHLLAPPNICASGSKIPIQAPGSHGGNYSLEKEWGIRKLPMVADNETQAARNVQDSSKRNNSHQIHLKGLN